MLLLISSAGIRRAVFSSGPLFSNAFLTNTPLTLTPPSASAAAIASSSTPSATAALRYRRPLISSRFMSTDVSGEKTEEEKAAIKAAREARK